MLSADGNDELVRRLPWTMVELAALLYRRQQCHLSILNSRQVFTADANATRASVRLMRECSRAFQPAELRRSLVTELQAPRQRVGAIYRPGIAEVEAGGPDASQGHTASGSLWQLVCWHPANSERYQGNRPGRQQQEQREESGNNIHRQGHMADELAQMQDALPVLQAFSPLPLPTLARRRLASRGGRAGRLSVRAMAAAGLPFQPSMPVLHGGGDGDGNSVVPGDPSVSAGDLDGQLHGTSGYLMHGGCSKSCTTSSSAPPQCPSSLLRPVASCRRFTPPPPPFGCPSCPSLITPY